MSEKCSGFLTDPVVRATLEALGNQAEKLQDLVKAGKGLSTGGTQTLAGVLAEAASLLGISSGNDGGEKESSPPPAPRLRLVFSRQG